jgi:hypothetical protein
MRWAVEISDNSTNRRLLSDLLGALSLNLCEESGRLIVQSSHFERLGTPSEVHGYASRICKIIEEVGRHNPEFDCSFSVGTVVERTDTGIRRHHFLVVSSAVHIHCSGHPTLIRGEPEQLTPEELADREHQENERKYAELRKRAVSRVVSAVRHNQALIVQQLLGEEQTPQVLGHIIDIIQDDLGLGLSKLLSANQQSRFYRSINHPKFSGRMHGI